MSEREVSAVAEDEDAGQRADVVLGRRVPGLSRRVARRHGLAGRLDIDGRRARPSDRVDSGQRLTLRLPHVEAPSGELRIIEVTDDFVYVDKSPGVHTIALDPEDPNCLSTMVAATHTECADASPDPREGGAVHRLDQATSGVVAFARTREAWERARAAFDSGAVSKRYLAVSVTTHEPPWPPRLPAGALSAWLAPSDPLPDPVELGSVATEVGDCIRIRAPIGRAEQRGRMMVRLDGQGATTFVQSRGTVAAGHLCELELSTGRRHQARVHLAWAGLPILGDALYSGAPSERLRLHAARLDLSVSFPGERPVTATIGPDFLGP